MIINRFRVRQALHRLNTLTEDRRLAIGLAGAIIAAITLVAVSVNMYYAGGFSRYDLSRPGYERERVEVTRPQPFKTYDVTSPISASTIDQFLAEFDTHRDNLKDFGDFRDKALSDKNLQIGD